ncbi:MAG: SRPBCC domain-containing protein [Thermomicrobiales bacterium]
MQEDHADDDGQVQRIAVVIHASAAAIYRAITDPALLVQWQAPGEMTARIEMLPGAAGYRMILRYPDAEPDARGKSGEREDRSIARYLMQDPPHRLVQAIAFETDDPRFAGEMTMETVLTPVDGGTEVAIAYRHLPPGIRREDNALGTRLSLEKLAALVEHR